MVKTSAEVRNFAREFSHGLDFSNVKTELVIFSNLFAAFSKYLNFKRLMVIHHYII